MAVTGKRLMIGSKIERNFKVYYRIWVLVKVLKKLRGVAYFCKNIPYGNVDGTDIK